MAWKASLEDPKSQFGRLHAMQWQKASPAERQHLVSIGAFTPEGLSHNHIASGYFSGLKDVGHLIGSGLKIAAPFAGFIPGVGPALAAALAAGGSAAGGALHGDRFSLGSTLGAGAAGYAGAKARGAGAATGTPGALHDAAYESAVGAAGNAAKSGVLSRAWDYVQKNPLKAAQIGLGGLSAIQGAKRQGQSDELLRSSVNRLNTPRVRVDLSDTFADPNNPYALGRGANSSAQRNARYALGGSY